MKQHFSSIRPEFEDGLDYRFRFDLGDVFTIFADSYSEIVEHLIPGYAEAESQDDRDFLRLLFSIGIAGNAQRAMIYENRKQLRLIRKHKHQVQKILTMSKAVSNFRLPAHLNPWNYPIPLILVAENYDWDGPDPDGNLIFIDNFSSTGLVLSLHQSGIGRISQLTDHRGRSDRDDER